MPIRYPNFNQIPINTAKPAYGYPQGTTGRAYTPSIIVLHWLGEEYEGYLAQGKTPAGKTTMAQFRHPMMHYLLGQEGYAARMCDPNNDAWSIMNVVAPTFSLPQPYPAVSPNRYTINIGIESGDTSLLTAEFLNAPKPQLKKVAYNKLVALIGMECDRWGITPSLTSIRPHSDFDTSEFAWCGEEIDYAQLVIDVQAWLAAGGEPCIPMGVDPCEYYCGGCQPMDGAKLYYSLPAGSILQVAPNGCGLVATSLPAVITPCTFGAAIPDVAPYVPQTQYIAVDANECLVRAPLPPVDPCAIGQQIPLATNNSVAMVTLSGENCLLREDNIPCFIGNQLTFSPVIVPPRWVGLDDDNCLMAFTPPTPLDACTLGATLGAAAEVVSFVVLDDSDCLVSAPPALVLCALGDAIISGGSEAAATSLVGISADNCLVSTGLVTPCTLGDLIQTGSAVAYVGLNSSDCLVRFTPPPNVEVTPCNFGAVIPIEADYNPAYVIALDDDNCLIAVDYPTLSGGLNPCTLGAVIPNGTITQLVGLNETNCLVKGAFSLNPCFNLAGFDSVLLSPNIVSVGGDGCLNRMNAPTYNGYLGIDNSGNYVNRQGVPLIRCGDATITTANLPSTNMRLMGRDGADCIVQISNGAVGSYLGINGAGQLAWQTPPAPTRCTIGALAILGTPVTWLGVDGSNCLVKFAPPTLPSIDACTIGAVISGGTATRWVGLNSSNCLVFFTPPTIPTAPTACSIGALANANANPAVAMVGLDSGNCLTKAVLPLFSVTALNTGITVASGSQVGLRLDPSACNGASLTANGLLVPANSTSLTAGNTTAESSTSVGVVIDTLNNTIVHQASVVVTNPSACRPLNVVINFHQGGISGTMYPDQGVRRVLELDMGSGSFAEEVGASSDYINGSVSFPAPHSTPVNAPQVSPTLLNSAIGYEVVHTRLDTIPAGGSRTYRMRSHIYAVGAGGAASQVVYYGNRIAILGVTS